MEIHDETLVFDVYNLLEGCYHTVFLTCGSFSQNPGKELCNKYMKTGECGFSKSCKYHHPPFKPTLERSNDILNNSIKVIDRMSTLLKVITNNNDCMNEIHKFNNIVLLLIDRVTQLSISRFYGRICMFFGDTLLRYLSSILIYCVKYKIYQVSMLLTMLQRIEQWFVSESQYRDYILQLLCLHNSTILSDIGRRIKDIANDSILRYEHSIPLRNFICQNLFAIIKNSNIFTNEIEITLQPFGSSGNNFGTGMSDLDLVLCINNDADLYGPHYHPTEAEAINDGSSSNNSDNVSVINTPNKTGNIDNNDKNSRILSTPASANKTPQKGKLSFEERVKLKNNEILEQLRDVLNQNKGNENEQYTVNEVVTDTRVPVIKLTHISSGMEVLIKILYYLLLPHMTNRVQLYICT
jgi:AraC-like DNA-binding protein